MVGLIIYLGLILRFCPYIKKLDGILSKKKVFLFGSVMLSVS